MSVPRLDESWDGIAPNPDVCEACGAPLDDGRPWQRGLDGAGIHTTCLQVIEREEDDNDG